VKQLPPYFLFLFLICFAITADAQYYNRYARNFGIGLKGGFSATNLSAGSGGNNPLSSGYSTVFGPDAGIFVEYKISDMISIQPELEYSTQGGKKNGLQAFPLPQAIAVFFQPGPAPQYLYANFNNQVKISYFMLPILLKLSWDIEEGSPFKFHIAGGPFVGYLYKANAVSTGTSTIYTDAKGQNAVILPPQSFNSNTDLKPQLQKLNYGIEGNIGITAKLDLLGANFVFLEIGGNYGLENIQKYANNGKNNTGAAVISFGYSVFF
jgi:hypothetical protein